MAPHALPALKKSSDLAAKRFSIRERSLRIHELSWFRFTTKPCLKDTSTMRCSKLTFHGPHHSVELMDCAYCDLLRRTAHRAALTAHYARAGRLFVFLIARFVVIARGTAKRQFQTAHRRDYQTPSRRKLNRAGFGMRLRFDDRFAPHVPLHQQHFVRNLTASYAVDCKVAEERAGAHFAERVAQPTLVQRV